MLTSPNTPQEQQSFLFFFFLFSPFLSNTVHFQGKQEPCSLESIRSANIKLKIIWNSMPKLQQMASNHCREKNPCCSRLTL